MHSDARDGFESLWMRSERMPIALATTTTSATAKVSPCLSRRAQAPLTRSSAATAVSPLNSIKGCASQASTIFSGLSQAALACHMGCGFICKTPPSSKSCPRTKAARRCCSIRWQARRKICELVLSSSVGWGMTKPAGKPDAPAAGCACLSST